MERFDEFFLFITSVLGLAFSLLYSMLGYREIIYGFLPLLIIGVVIPIYIGYVRGAILLDMLEERVRGWIYFLIGVICYTTFTIFFIVNKLLLVLNVKFEIFSGLFSFACFLLMGYFLGRRGLYRWFCRNIFEAFDHKMTELIDKIYADTSGSAFFTGIFFYMAFQFSISENLDVSIALMIIFGVSMGVVFFIVYERDIRKWVNLLRFSDFIEIKSARARSRIPIGVGKVSFLIYIVIAAIFLIIWKWLPLVVTMALTIVLMFNSIILTLSTETEYTPVKKKDVPKDIEIELTKLLDRITKKEEKGKREKNEKP